MTASLAELAVKKYGVDRLMSMLSDEQRERIRYEWAIWARPEQLPPAGGWLVWLVMAGRGFGKTRTGAEMVRSEIESGRVGRAALVAPTAADARDVMVEGESGLLAVCPPAFRPEYEPSKRRITWPNGAQATVYTADEPERLRGPQHDFAWCLVAGTMVTMADGSEKPIERIEVGNVVMTRKGARRVLASMMTRRNAPTWTLTGSHGRTIEGTAEHLVYSENRFRPLREITPGTILLSWQEPLCVSASSSSSTGRTISETRADDYSTGFYGSQLTDRSRPDTSSTTSTRTSSTIELRTLSSCFAATTCDIMGLAGGRSWSLENERTGPRNSGATGSQSSVSAGDAAHHMSLAPPIAHGADRNAGSLRAITALRSESTGRSADVYDITVEGDHEFFANGILVHNCDEPASWRYPDAWDMLQFGLRLGERPRIVVTGTPKPVKLIRDLLRASTTVVTGGSTYDNKANLAASFFDAMDAKYKGTRLGRQELYAEVLDDVPGALWQRSNLDEHRVSKHPDLVRIVVAVDPSGGHTEENDEQGIVVAGLGVDGRGYVLADRSCKLSPDGWGRRAVAAYGEFAADRIVYEQNYGGEMCQHVIVTSAKAQGSIVATKMLHASRGKVVRAEPVAALYEQGRVSHVGSFDELEDEQCAFSPLGLDGSPNRVDALVWALTELMVSAPVAEPWESLGLKRVTASEPSDEDDEDDWDT